MNVKKKAFYLACNPSQYVKKNPKTIKAEIECWIFETRWCMRFQRVFFLIFVTFEKSLFITKNLVIFVANIKLTQKQSEVQIWKEDGEN